MTLDPVGYALWGLAALWCIVVLDRIRDLRYVSALPALEEHGTGSGTPRPSVSIIIAARNEEARVEHTVCRLLDQRGIDLDVVVVDDRSTDATPDILARLDRRHSRLTVVRVDRLPSGWLGKTHACHLGSRAARGEWLLFTDADTWLGDDVLLRSVRAAESTGADHLCLFPGEARTTFAAKAALLGFWMAMLLFAARANRDRRRSFIGVGAFNLVRRQAYQSVGGHESLRMEIIDDLRLGWRLRRAGFRSRAFVATADMTVQWASTIPGLVRALDKNYFAVFGFSFVRAAAAVLAMSAALGGALLAPLTGRIEGIAAGLAVAALAVPAGILARRGGWSVAPALLTPLVSGVLIFAITHSALSVARRGGIEWRDTFYPLEELRRGHAGPFLG